MDFWDHILQSTEIIIYNRLGFAYVDNMELWLTIPDVYLVHLVSNMQEIA